MDAQTIKDVSNCEDGRYPYPDACVKLVMGLELDSRADIPRMATMVIVSTKDDVAEARFNNRCPDFCAHTTSSLDDVRWQVQQLRDLDAKRKDGWLLRKLRKPYMVTFRWTMGVLHRRFVLAMSAADAYLHVVPQPYAGTAVALSDLEALLTRMERAKTGEEKVEYAWDYRKGGDWRRAAAERIARWPPREKAWADEQIRNHRHFFPNDQEHGLEKQDGEKPSA
ncbi:TPA: hypothetical protein QDB43_000344 [Burkholderia vietnamiensis]|nr:hypothetical protein [Burkholderia vietnamiensis]